MDNDQDDNASKVTPSKKDEFSKRHSKSMGLVHFPQDAKLEQKA